MQRRGSAACCLGEFGDMDLDTAMQEVEAESEQCVDGDLPHPWEKKRDEDKTGGCERAPGDHQNDRRIANTPRQPSMSPITPAIEEPTRLPVRATASSRLIATWR